MLSSVSFIRPSSIRTRPLRHHTARNLVTSIFSKVTYTAPTFFFLVIPVASVCLNQIK
ncbi:hypothetical protein F5H01DRAFT_390167 [Linnemannia elongata]|nr:hypothetical protein F5H01DRAFT_390167 [Linnemannia elongata]